MSIDPAVMFPTMAQHTAPAPVEPTLDERAAEIFYGGKSEAKRETNRDPGARTTEQVMYGDTDPRIAHSDAARAIENSAMQDHFADPNEAREIADAWAATFQRYGLNATQSTDLAQLGAASFARPPSSETLAAWQQDARQGLLAEYGATGVAQALEDAQALVAQDPALRSWLDRTGLGNHPRVVALVADKARQMRLAGRL